MKPSTTHVADLSGTDAEYQGDQTQSARFEALVPDQNKGKPLYEGELCNQPLILSTVADVQALLLSDEKLMEESEDDVFEAGDEMDEDNEEETQSPSPNKEQPESSHAQETTESDTDSSCPEVLKRYDNVLPLTERQLEATASYADLKSKNEGFHDVAYKVHKGIEAAFSTYEKFRAHYGKDVEKILGSLKVIQDVVKEDPDLNKKASALRQDEHLAAWAKFEISSLKQDTSEIRSMMIEIFKGENFTHVATEEPPSYTEGENDDMETQKIKVEKETEEVPTRPTKAVPISTIKPITRPNPKLEMIGSSSRIQLTDTTLALPYLNKDKEIKKKAKEARLLAMTKSEIIKVVHKEAEKAKINPKIIESAKGGEQFKKDSGCRNPGVKIHPNIKPAVLTVYKGNDRRNFDVHNPFKFADFKVIELDELGPIIEKKKNKIDALLAPVPEQASSQLLGKKRTRMELEYEICIPVLECNISLPEGIPFVNNMVIEEPEYGMFFTDVFGDEAFQRCSEIKKVGVDTLITYLVMASNIKTQENARFYQKLRELIAKHPDQEKLK
ncbi:hypothetical protein Tco_1086077 [Tanacetum coccineum]